MWWFPAIDTADVGPAEVASQPVHHVVVGETAAEVRDNGLDALGEAPGIGVERGEALHRGLRLCRERGAVDADGTAARDHEIDTLSTAPPFSVNTIWLVALLSGTKLTWSRSSSTRSAL